MSMRVGVVGTSLLIALLGTGCRGVWREPRYSPLLATFPVKQSLWSDAAAGDGANGALQAARDCAADAGLAELAGSAESTDLHYQAAVASWTALCGLSSSGESFQSAWAIYHTSLSRLITTAQDGGHFMPGQGIVVHQSGVPTIVPLTIHSSVWRTEDVQAIYPVGEYHTKLLSRQHRTSGWGVPVVVERRCATTFRAGEEFLSPGVMFAATAVLRPCGSGGAALELFDPIHPQRGSTPTVQPLAGDLSAPFALRAISSPELQSDWLSFFGIDKPTREGLLFIEPYQPGKIPVVLVHGLLSNPMAWVDMANDLRAVPGFSDRFQLWGFRYATEAPFLESASRLRNDLYRAMATIDPAGQDPALRQVALVGHSMGGLICELQAVSSQDLLWNTVSNRPIDAIVATNEARRALRDMFFFNPQPYVRTVISIAAPHRGSSFAKRPIGRLGAKLAEPDPARAARHAQLMRDNPAVFSEEVAERVPSSIDMLDPDSAILTAIAALPLSPCVDLHTIVGYGRESLFDGQGDGVVAIESALNPKAVSQVGVEASHMTIHRNLSSVAEVLRILNERWARYVFESVH